jgi:hypothetical protein
VIIVPRDVSNIKLHVDALTIRHGIANLSARANPVGQERATSAGNLIVRHARVAERPRHQVRVQVIARVAADLPPLTPGLPEQHRMAPKRLNAQKTSQFPTIWDVSAIFGLYSAE